jgi:hypothetical protein
MVMISDGVLLISIMNECFELFLLVFGQSMSIYCIWITYYESAYSNCILYVEFGMNCDRKGKNRIEGIN